MDSGRPVHMGIEVSRTQIKMAKAGKLYANGWTARVQGYPLFLVQLQRPGKPDQYWTASANAVVGSGASRKDAILDAISSLEMEKAR